MKNQNSHKSIQDFLAYAAANKVDMKKCTEETPPPFDFVLPGFVSGTLGALIGTGGTSKSMLALQEAVHVATGADTLGTGAVPKGRVVVLSLEDGTTAIHHRIHAIAKKLNPTQREDLWSNLEIYTFKSDVMAFGGQHIVELCRGARFIVVDTLRRAHKLDENKSDDMAALVQILEDLAEKTGAAVLFAHHQNKAAITAGTASDAGASRGHSILTDNPRYCAALAGIPEKNCVLYGIDRSERRHFVMLSFPKPNYGPPMPDVLFRRGEGGVLERAELDARQNVKPAKERKERVATAQEYSNAKRKGNYVASFD